MATPNFEGVVQTVRDNYPKIIGGVAGLWLMYKTYRLFKPAFLTFKKPDNSAGKVVIISGCDTGFGHLLAKRLDDDGYSVVALCLTDEGCKTLQDKCSDRIFTLKFDITKQENIDGLKDTLLERGINRIWALVNNAGIARATHVEICSMEDYRLTMEVNLFGHIAMCKTFIPFIPRGGRIVNMASIAGRISTASMTSYSVSKFAMTAFSDGLRREMRPFGIHVSGVEPGFMKTQMTHDLQGKTRQMWHDAPKDIFERYGEEYLEDFIERASRIDQIVEDPQQVVQAYAHAVGHSSPEMRYVVGKQTPIISWIASMPLEWQDSLMRRDDIKVLPAAAK